LSFLPVGHTHEDIDSRFAAIAEKLRKTNAETIQNLRNMLQNSEMINTLFDIKSWISPHLNKIHHITNPLHFKVKLADSNIKIYYKGVHNDAWKCFDNTMLNSVPSNKPSLVKPSFEKFDAVKHKKLIENNKFMFTERDSLQKWTHFYNSVEQSDIVIGEWLLPMLPRQQTSSNRDMTSQTIPTAITDLLEKERRVLPVKITS